MDLQAALLCEAAVAHDTLLSLVDAGRTQVVGVDFPLPLRMTLALMVNCEESDLDSSHEMRIEVVAAASGAAVGTASRPFSVLPMEIPSAVNVPLVADLSPIGLPDVGDYEVRVFIDDKWLAVLPIQALRGG